MDFPGYQLPEELQLLQRTVRRIIQEEIVPLERSMDPEATELDEANWQRLAAMNQHAGLWALGAPQEYGGGGLSTFAYCLVLEELAQHRNGLYNPGYATFGRYPPNVCYAGSPEQMHKYVIPTIREAKKAFFAITEPSGGADPAGAIQTRGVRDGDHWVINGTKTWISGGIEAEWGIVFVRTDASKGRKGISCFFVDRDTPGLSMRLIPVIRPYYPSELVFKDCVVPHANLLGGEGEGLDLALRLLTKNRFTYSAANIGVAVAALRMAVAYARQRSTFGQLLGQRQAIQWMLADSEVEIRAARWLTWEGAWKVDRGEDHRHEASIAKLYSSEMLGRVVDRAVQIHGGYGVAKEVPLERWYREARVRRIGEGPSEVQRMVIARNLLPELKRAREVRAMPRICVFCGSQAGTNGIYRQTATDMGRLLALRGYGLVYGGGHVGLMGVIADTVLAMGGEVIGVIPESMVARELAHTGVTRLDMVPGMHERKARMAALADAFIALPGGYGTFEELFEIITWAQIGLHRKPIGLLNVAGYFDALRALVEHAITEGFIRSEHRRLLTIADAPATLLDTLGLGDGRNG